MNHRTFTLANPNDWSSGVDWDAPLPLGYKQATRRALELRFRNPNLYTYTVIAAIMGEYHGFHRSHNWWRTELVKLGAPKSKRGSANAHYLKPAGGKVRAAP